MLKLTIVPVLFLTWPLMLRVFIYESLNKLCLDELHKTQLTLFNLVRQLARTANGAKFIFAFTCSAFRETFYSILTFGVHNSLNTETDTQWFLFASANERHPFHPFIHQMCTVRRTDELHPWYGNFTGQFMASFRQIESFVYYVKYVSPFSTHFLQLHLCNSCAPSASRTPTGLATSRPDFNCGRLSTWSVVCGCVWRLSWHWAKLRHSIVLNLGIMYLYLDHYLLSYYYFID